MYLVEHEQLISAYSTNLVVELAYSERVSPQV